MASHNEGKKIHWGFAALSFLIGGYSLFTGILLSGLGHLPNSKWEYVMLGVFLSSVSMTLWTLTLAGRLRPGLFTYLFGLAGIASLYCGLFFFA